MTPAPPAPAGGTTRGALYALGAYLLWGVLPIYFLQLKPTDPFEVVAWRIILAFAFCLLLLTVLRAWRPFLAIVRQPRLMALTALAGVLIYVNWQTYLIGALTEHVIETSLGYFINPIVTVLLGVVVLRERLRVLPWIAIGIAVLAVVVIVVGYGAFPWIALTLAASFGVYGLVKKQIGPSVDAVSGLTLESLWLLPVAVIQLFVVASVSGITLGAVGTLHTALLLSAGAVTAVPLLLFASGARRVPLTVIGLLQFVAPIIQFAIGVWVLHEPMTAERWIGFALVWVALVILSVDSILASRRHRRVVDDVTEPV
ncbi:MULTISPECIES: EamA family transporter RarD [Microbacterium]|uniref:EamA family transporter RarD n=1 Tax=Microbacterium TaxID=33882 RepID=UPI00277E1DF9|nr:MULTISPECIES: EamA family transporter RarD [Microbacterium]MDQ1083039.1 chloramphenicol-sensitive protein RarD [Microbacterium sp. SORGH_AS_0344]MDQ1171690.1 chloramphenicol-sensitive protein RarD [Microbacterium proteolyticum]